MTDSNLNPEVESLFAAFIERREAGEEVDVESLCAEHPEHAESFRWLWKNYIEFSVFGHRRKEFPDPPPDTPEGRTFGGDFRLIRFLCKGGMGEVWEGEQISLKRRVAVKLVLPHLDTKKSLAFFEREALAGARLNHPGIIAVYAYGVDEDVAWIAMELVEGAWTLKDFLAEISARKALPPTYYRQVMTFLAGLADAVDAVHQKHIIHRDVTPANVLVTPDDRPKLGDFGLAKISDEDPLSDMGDFVGTLPYMSPEAALAKRMGIDHRTDIFSFGVILYELLTLQRPFAGETDAKLMEQIVTKDPVSPRSISPRVPRKLAVICEKCLEKDRDQRYATMADLADDIRRYLNGQPILARPPGPLRRAEKWVRQNRFPVTLVLILSLGFAVVYTLNRWGKARLTIDSLPTGATVYVRELEWRTGEYGSTEKIGVTPLTGSYVPPGHCRIVLVTDTGFAEIPAFLEAYELHELPDPVPIVDTPSTREGMVSIEASSELFWGGFKLGDKDYPREQVSVDDFYIDVFEVTNQQYREFLRANPNFSEPETWAGAYNEEWDKMPVVNVTSMQAQAYATWIGKRLPTRREWDRAARGTDGRRFPWGDSAGNNLREAACIDREGSDPLVTDADWFARYIEVIHNVGSNALDVSPDGVHDVLGSVTEWVESFDISGGVLNPGQRNARGDSWRTLAGKVGLNRVYSAPADDTTTEADFGFRCAKSAYP